MKNMIFNNGNYSMADFGGCDETRVTGICQERYTIDDFKKEYISSDYDELLSKLVERKFILLEGHVGLGKSHLAECLAKLIVGYNDMEGHLIRRLFYGSNTAHYLKHEYKGDKPIVVIIDGINLSEHNFVDINDVPDNVYIICTTLGDTKPIQVNGLENFYRYTPENILGTEALKNYIKEKFKNEEILKNTLCFLDIIKDTDISMRWLEDLENMIEIGQYSNEMFRFAIVEQTKIKCQYHGFIEVSDRLQNFMIE